MNDFDIEPLYSYLYMIWSYAGFGCSGHSIFLLNEKILINN